MNTDQTPFTREFSLFRGGIRVIKPTGPISLATCVDLIRSDQYAGATQASRTAASPQQKLLKEKLDFVTFSATFAPTRLANNVQQHSGLICLDFDHVANLVETRLQLQADPHTLMLFTSPSGNGIKLIVAVHDLDIKTSEAWPDRHKTMFVDLAHYIRHSYGLDVDASGSDVSRACFLPHDAQVFINRDADPYCYKGLAKAERQRSKRPLTQAQAIRNASDVYEHVLAVVERIEAARVDISGGSGEYDTRLLLAFCMATLGEAGRGLLHRVLVFYPNYTTQETDSKFDQGLHTSRFTTPCKFFQICKDHGIDVGKPGSRKKEKPAGEPLSPGEPTESQTPKATTGKVAATATEPDGSKVPMGNESRGKKAKHDKEATYSFKTVDYRNDGIWIWGTKNWICVAENFQIFVKYCTEDENEEKTWILEVVVRRWAKPIYIEVTHDEFCSATKLKNKMAGHRLALKLTDTYLGEWLEHLFRQEFPQAQKVMRLGFHVESGVFFFANKAVNTGRVNEILEPDEFNIVTATVGDSTMCLSMPTVKKKHANLFTLSSGTMTFTTWFNWLSLVHKYENAVIPASFYLMGLFRDIVVKHTGTSPILYLKGGASSGKSSMARSMIRLYNLHEAAANLKNKNTQAGLVRVMSQHANALTWMDEYHNEFPFTGLLQSAYDDNGYVRAEENSSHGTDSVDIYSALVLTSNYIPENLIFFSRCVFIPITDQQRNDTQVENFARFRDVEQGGLSCVTLAMLAHRSLVEAQFKTAYDALFKGLNERTKHEGVLVRLKSNMACILAVPFILQSAGKVAMMEFTDVAEILREFIEIGVRAILRQHTIQTEKTALSEFFELMQNQYEGGYLQEEIHFRFVGELIYLRFPSLYIIYAQRCRQTYWKAPADRDTLKSEMVALEGTNDPDNFFKNIRFVPDASDHAAQSTRSVSGSCAMTYSKLVDAFGLDLRGRRVAKVTF